MRTIVRSIAVLAATAGLVAACNAAATSTQAPTSAPTPAAPTATPAPPDPTPSPAPPTAAPSVEPMEPAYVTGTGTLSQVSQGTTTPDGDCTRIDNVVVEANGTSTDPRVAGPTTATVHGIDCGGVGFQWGTMTQTTADGAWEGTCTGGMWADQTEGDISCWLVGSGAYEGLTYFMHSRHVGLSTEVDGVILPAAPPSPAP